MDSSIKSVASRKHAPPDPETPQVQFLLGYAATVIFLLKDYETFGLAERICYHFDLIESKDSFTDESSSLSTSEISHVSGVVRLLECSPLAPIHRLNRRQRRILKTQMRAFNDEATKIRQEKAKFSYKPTKLPLRVNPSTRMFFAYEITRIAFCIDASPSATSTFGITGGNNIFGTNNTVCCPLDRIGPMARTYFQSLVDPVSAPSVFSPDWRPTLSVTVMAVFPLGKTAETTMLVRDYRVNNEESAKVLADKIDEWVHTDVEEGIAERMCRPHMANTWGLPLYSSSIRDILEAGDYALNTLSSEARPILVLATDCRSLSCDGIVDVFLDIDRVDVPVSVLDLSMPETHTMEHQHQQLGAVPPEKSELSFLTYDPGGPASFPLHLSDDAEALYGICRATGGCFLDAQRLEELSTQSTGQVATSENAPYQNAVKRRFVKMNGIQWLTLFSQSPLSPTFHSSWGKLAPPQYIQKRMGTAEATASNETTPQPIVGFEQRSNSRLPDPAQPGQKRAHTHSRTIFSTYVVSPIRIKALLLMRIKEGYRVKQYGLGTQDADKVFIQFTLPLELGTILHYELSFRALSSQARYMVGSAHIKIELSGDSGFIQSVKNDFLRQTHESRPFTMAQKISSRLCQVIRWIRKEDCLLSYLSPPAVWPDELPSPFVRRLDTMTILQRRRHFTFDQFDVICRGMMPYAVGDGFLSEFLSLDNGEQDLFDFMNEWSTQVVKEETMYIKRASSSDGSTSYCLVELQHSQFSRLFAVSVMFYGGMDPNDRMEILCSLKRLIGELKEVEVLGKQLSPYLVGLKRKNVHYQHHHATWDLLKDPELLPLLMKRRAELGRFRLLESSDERAIFAKLIPEAPPIGSPGDLVQYQIEVLSDKVVIDLFMEPECGEFFPFGSSGGGASRFNGMGRVLRRRDQECGRALFSRRNLLSVFQSGAGQAIENPSLEIESHKRSVQRMLAYCSKVSIRIRFFSPGTGAANEILFHISENALLSESFGVRSAKLRIDPTETIKDKEPGVWFIIQFDRDAHALSIVHLALSDKQEIGADGDNFAFRELTFFTNGVSDLYSKRDDMVDDDSDDSHISEYLCVSDFAEHFNEAQKENFAVAAYLALRKDAQPPVEALEKRDFAEVLQVCDFVEVANVLVMGIGSAHDENHSIADEHRKLYHLINLILQNVPGEDQFMFYSGNFNRNENIDVGDAGSVSQCSLNSSMDLSLGTESADGFGFAPEEELFDVSHRISAENSQLNPDNEASVGMSQNGNVNTITQPIFVRFKLDGEIASTSDLQAISKSTNLSAEISVFKPRGNSITHKKEVSDNAHLPWSHQLVAADLRALLKSHVAEETVELLRHHGHSISDGDMKLVKRCLKKVRSVVFSSVEVYFYISKTDSMVSASAPAGGESEVSEGFLLLETELLSNRAFAFKTAAGGGFLVSSKGQDSKAAFDFWCLVGIEETEGTVTARIYHPLGREKAWTLSSEIHTEVSLALHRVNQQLLLKSLHRSRNASLFLIPSPGRPRTESDADLGSGSNVNFVPGAFSCPTVFRTDFDLYHRCATNPSQVAHKLEATVLHSFDVSNRPGVFVYKDEGGAIFYMTVKPIGSGIDGDGKVELIVRGIHEPGPSVTNQLRKLLQRRILQIAADMLSSVLTKNPHFNWKRADVDFLRSFESDWMTGEAEKPLSPQECFYEFPVHATDPCMVLLMFRQNLCGSTYFHRLNDVGHDGLSPEIEECRELDEGGVVLRWNEHEFTLYYNNAPSKLDPGFQGVSTLTSKGAVLCREAGNGIALLEVSLVRSSGDPVEDLEFAQPARPSDSTIGVSLESLRFRKLDSFPCPQGRDSICARVRITNTDLAREHLHEWIELTLNQAIIVWTMERLLEKSSLKLLRPQDTEEETCPLPESGKLAICDKLCPGLPAVLSICESSHGLPHPAISKTESLCVNRSSSVATATLQLLERCILAPLFSEQSQAGQPKPCMSSITTLRLSRYSMPCLVSLSWDSNNRKAIVRDVSKGTQAQQPIEDSPVDCPEYICFCSQEQYGEKSTNLGSHVTMFREVMIHDGISERSPSIELLENIKKKQGKAFNRSLAFVFSVKRNRRLLYSYNWHPQVVKSVSAKLIEASAVSLQESQRKSFALQYRSLRLLSPSKGNKNTKLDRTVESQVSNTTEKESKPATLSENNRKVSYNEPAESAPTRKIRRPVSIRRPKLIGKSVEGAALQAVAASRKRASANQFRNIATTSPVKRSTSQGSVRDNVKGSPKLSSKASDKSSKKPPRLPPQVREVKDKVERDDELIRIKRDFDLLCSPKSSGSRMLCYRQRFALAALADVWWPKKEPRSIPRSAVEFLLSKTPLAWSDTCYLPPMPLGATQTFLPIFARWIVAFTPGLKIVQVSQPKGTVMQKDSVFLSTVTKNLRGSKCFVVIKITKTRVGNVSPIIRCQGWVLNLPRRSRERQKKKGFSNITSLLAIEKDAAGMNKLSSETHDSLLLESLLFDFSASMVERTARLPDGRADNLKDLIPTIRGLIARHPFQQQKRMPILNYRAFEATVVLKSYKDRFIDMFDSHALFQRLNEEADHRDMLRCGVALCFKKGISVRGSHSVAFLTTHPVDTSKMLLVILCRTQGRSLSQFMFREGSNVAIHVLDNIVVEAAGLAFKELKFVAERLRRDALWKTLSSSSAGRDNGLTQGRINEMLSLTTVRPLLQALGNNTSAMPEFTALLSRELCVDWNSCCLCMAQDASFSPHWSIEGDWATTHLFFIQQEDMFLWMRVDKNNILVRAALVEKDSSASQEQRQIAVQKFLNFLLHFIWQCL